MVIWDWVQQLLFGVIQTILYWIPLLKPEVVPLVPHDFYLPCEEFYGSWADLLDEEQRPTYNWITLFWDCIWPILFSRVDDRILELVDKVMHYVVFAVGMLPLPFYTIPQWIDAIVGWIGETLPVWAGDIVSGLTRLWELIPEPIRDGLQTWSEFVAGAPGAIQDWVEEFVGRTIELVVELWDWYIELGQTITEWWEGAHDELNGLLGDAYGWIARALGETWDFLVWFWSDPTTAVASWLSPWWESLVTFASDCLEFWYEVWASYAELLAEFLEDPLSYLWREGEEWLSERLERP